MANPEQVPANDTTSSLIEQLGKAFSELEALKDASDNNVQWKEIEEHFHNFEMMLKKKSEELEAKEKEYKEKETETHALLAERESDVIAKEQEFIDRVQELKDAAVAAIEDARANYQLTSFEPIDGGDNQDNKVSSSLGVTNFPEDIPLEMGENAEGVDVKPRPELTQFCKTMDSKGLLNFTMENHKSLYAIRKELSVALESATEPAHLVLDILDGFYPPDETDQPKDKKDAALQGMRISCIMFIEAMAALLARVDAGADHLLNPETKQRAKAIAEEWKHKLASAGTNAANANLLEAEALLQLLATFRIASEFDEEELCKLVLVVARRRQAPELCRYLGLSHKVPGVVESLINSGKQIDAVRFIHAFQLSENFPSVPLLKAYLKELRRNSQGKGGNTSGGGGQIDVNAQELAALKAVIGCVEEFKLEADYPLDPLHKRVAQLERSKSDKKRSGDFGKHQQHAKKQRANGGGYRGSRAPAGRQGPSVFVNRAGFRGVPERYHPQAGPNPYDYQVPGQPAYAAQQANDQRLYYYPQDDRVPPTSFNAAPAPANYGGYMGSGLQPSHQPYM